MLKSKTRGGYTLLEVMIAVSIFTLIIFCGLTIHIAKLKEKTYNFRLNQYSNYVDRVGNLIVNFSYNDIVTGIGSGTKYIDYEGVDIDGLDLSNLVTAIKPAPNDLNRCIRITVDVGEVLKILVELNYNTNGRTETIGYVVYKGNYN